MTHFTTVLLIQLYLSLLLVLVVVLFPLLYAQTSHHSFKYIKHDHIVLKNLPCVGAT